MQGSQGIEAGTTADADADNTLCFVGGELVSYSAAAVTGQDQYTAGGYLRRGRMGSVQAPHAAGELFLRLDSAVWKYTYDPAWAGKTVQLKFQSFNVYQKSVQDPSALTAIAFTIPGLNPGTVDAATGLIIGLTSTSIPPNVPYNTGNNCTLTTGWDEASSTAWINGDGPGGTGTTWEFFYGQGGVVHPAFSMTGEPGGTSCSIVYNTKTGVASVETAYTDTLNDFLIFLGDVTTATATKTGSGGGGGAGGGSPIRGGGGIEQPPNPD